MRNIVSKLPDSGSRRQAGSGENLSITRVEALRLNVPIRKPYRLSFGSVHEFSSVLVMVSSEAGMAIGESTPLPGYSWGNIGDVWEFVLQQGSGLPGKRVGPALDDLSQFIESKPFSVSPFIAALEELAGAMLVVNETFEIPLIGVVDGASLDEIEGQVMALLDQGYGTIKVKVGQAVDHDIHKIKLVSSLIDDLPVKLRIDANQGYEFGQALELVHVLEPDKVELLEQPLKAQEWSAMNRLFEESQVKLMLDESIWSEEDLIRACSPRCAHLVKLKLMKHASPGRTKDLAHTAQDLGFEVVLGNGVKTEVGCSQEATLYADIPGIHLAAEMNGYLKQRESILMQPLEFHRGSMVIRPGYSPKLDEEKVSQMRVDRRIWQ